MNKIATLCCTLLLTASFTAPVLAANPVKTDMKAMGKSLRAASEANDAAGMKAELTKLREYSVHAKEQIPPDFKDQPADGTERKAYIEGLDILIKQVDDAIALLDAGKLDEAKAALDGMVKTKKEYHKKLKV
jgi:soluble cytochrome b562